MIMIHDRLLSLFIGNDFHLAAHKREKPATWSVAERYDNRETHLYSSGGDNRTSRGL
jgi:hypothetical protein